MCDVADIEWLMRRGHGDGKFLRPLTADRTGNMAHAWPAPPAAEGGRVREAVLGFLTTLTGKRRVRRNPAGHNIPKGRFE